MTKSIVTDFGADPTFGSDSTAALNAALACVTDEVFWDAGRYKITGPLHAFSGGSHRGCPNLTTVETMCLAGDVLSIRGAGLTLKGIGLVSATQRTSGALIAVLDGTSSLRLAEYVLANGFDGIHIYPGSASAILNFNDGSIRDCAPALGSAVLIDQGLAVKFDGLIADNAQQILSAFHVRNAGDVLLTNGNLMHGGACVLLDAGAGQIICSFWTAQTYFDTSNYGLVAHAHDGGTILRGHSDRCWYGSAAATGVWLGADATSVIDGFDFDAPDILFGKGSGFEVAGVGANTRNVTLLGPKIGNGGAAGTNSGLVVADGAPGLQVIGGHIGAVSGAAGFGFGMWFWGALPKGVVRDVALYANSAPFNVAPLGASAFAPAI